MSEIRLTPSNWGPAVTGKSYNLLAGLGTCATPPVSLPDHGLTGVSQELSDPVVVEKTIIKGGRRVTINQTIERARETGRTYTVLMPSGLWTPLKAKAEQDGACEINLYARFLCPEKADYDHFKVYPDVTLNPPVETADFIVNDATNEPFGYQTEAQMSELFTAWNLRWDIVRTQPLAVNSVKFIQGTCVGCSDSIFTDAISVGVAGIAGTRPTLSTTDDRFATQTELTGVGTAIPVDAEARIVYTEGDLRLVGFSDTNVVSTAATGGIVASFDGGLTYALATGVAVPIHSITKFAGVYIAVGGAGAGPGAVFVSTNGANWTAVTSSLLTGVNAMIAVAADEEAFYVSGEGARLLRGEVSGGVIVLSDLSANLGGSPGDITAVAVLGRDHLMVGGASGYVAESFDGGLTWNLPFTAGAAAVGAIAGNCFRVLVGAGSTLYERSLLTDSAFKPVTLKNGATVTGNYTSIQMGDLNYFLASTSGGNILLARPQYPNS